MPEELIHAIPNFNSPEYENLIGTLQNGTCIFIGAGVSKLAGYKLWDELKNKLVDYFWEKRKEMPGELDYSLCNNLKIHEAIIETFDYLYIMDRELFISGVKEIFDTDERNSSNEIYQFLNKLNNGNSFFVTPNIDRGLQKYLGIPNEHISIYPTFTNPPKHINYLHGRIDFEDTWILTSEQYIKGYKAYDNDTPCMNILTHIFESYNILFIGYGLREDEIMQAILKTGKRKLHYWLEPFSRNTKDFIKIRSTTLKGNYNIMLIPYSIDKNDYEELHKVIDLLYMEITKKEHKL